MAVLHQVVVADGAAGNGHGGRLAIKSTKPLKQSRELVESALREDMQAAADTFGHIGFRRRVEAYADALARQNQKAAAKAIRKDMVAALRARGVPEQYLQGAAAPAPKS